MQDIRAFHKFVAFWLPLTLTLTLSQEGEGKEFSSLLPIGRRVGDEGTQKSFRHELVQFCTKLSGTPTAKESSLDADLIICAQWRILAAQHLGQMSIIATTNVKHLSRFATASRWQDILI